MSMSGVHGPARDAESIRTIHAALDGGVNLFDTGDFYGAGRNELLLRSSLRSGVDACPGQRAAFGLTKTWRPAMRSHPAPPGTRPAPARHPPGLP